MDSRNHHQTSSAPPISSVGNGHSEPGVLRSAPDTFNPGKFCAMGLSWLDHILDNGGREVAANAFSAGAGIVRRHPTACVALGVGGIALAWMKNNAADEELTLVQRALSRAEEARDRARGFQRSAVDSGSEVMGSVQSTASKLARLGRSAAAASAGAMGETYLQSVDRLSDDGEWIAEKARELGHDVGVGYRKAKQFSRDKPAIAVAGGVALAISAMLLAKLIRR